MTSVINSELLKSLPILRGRLREFEHHRQTCSSSPIAFCLSVTKSNGRERRLDRVRCSQVAPVLSREVVER